MPIIAFGLLVINIQAEDLLLVKCAVVASMELSLNQFLLGDFFGLVLMLVSKYYLRRFTIKFTTWMIDVEVM